MLNKNIEKIFNDEALKLINSKNDDYANPTDFYANFRMVEYAGLPTWIGVHVRMLDKISRLNGFVRRFIETGDISSNHESIEDTLLDAINYSAITLDTYRQYLKEKNHEHQPRTVNSHTGEYSEDQAGKDRTQGGQNSGNIRVLHEEAIPADQENC